jgi:hypothetical protein
MSRKLMSIFLGLSLALTVIAVIAYLAGFAALFAATADSSSRYYEGSSTGDLAVGGFFGAIVVSVIAGLAASGFHLAALIGALIRQAKQQDWVWFTLSLVVGSIPLLIYVIIWPNKEPQQQVYYQPVTAYQQPYIQPQQPYYSPQPYAGEQPRQD